MMLWVMVTLILFITAGFIWVATSDTTPKRRQAERPEISEERVREIIEQFHQAADTAGYRRSTRSPSSEDTWTTSTTYVRLYPQEPDEESSESSGGPPPEDSETPEPRSRFARLASLQDREGEE